MIHQMNILTYDNYDAIEVSKTKRYSYGLSW